MTVNETQHLIVIQLFILPSNIDFLKFFECHQGLLFKKVKQQTIDKRGLQAPQLAVRATVKTRFTMTAYTVFTDDS